MPMEWLEEWNGSDRTGLEGTGPEVNGAVSGADRKGPERTGSEWLKERRGPEWTGADGIGKDWIGY